MLASASPDAVWRALSGHFAQRRPRPQDRMAMLARLLTQDRWAAFLVTPATLLR
jgi:hypothetical protein